LGDDGGASRFDCYLYGRSELNITIVSSTRQLSSFFNIFPRRGASRLHCYLYSNSELNIAIVSVTGQLSSFFNIFSSPRRAKPIRMPHSMYRSQH
jgi:hypothetical protein